MILEKREQELYDELSYYTLSHPDPSFIHQYIVDTFCAQTADDKTKPIAITFALAGLYLHIEKNYSGKMVQRMHVVMAKYKEEWPTFTLPKNRGDIRVSDVLAISPGPLRDEKINKWSLNVWQLYKESHGKIAVLLEKYLKIF